MAGGMGGGFGGGFRPAPWMNFGQQPMYGPANQPAQPMYGPSTPPGQMGLTGWNPAQQQFQGQQQMPWQQPMWNQPFGGRFSNWQGWASGSPTMGGQQQPQQQPQQQMTQAQPQPFGGRFSNWQGWNGPQAPAVQVPSQTIDQMLAQLRQFQGR